MPIFLLILGNFPNIMLWSSKGNDIETKAERSFDLGFVFDIEAKQTCYSRTCKDRSEANPAYSTP
jgi:hypothetical protein